MSFDASIHKLYLAPSVGLAGKTFYVVILVTTASGGTDKVIAKIQVTNGGSGFAPAQCCRRNGCTWIYRWPQSDDEWHVDCTLCTILPIAKDDIHI
jgi:hypothetical protein